MTSTSRRQWLAYSMGMPAAATLAGCAAASASSEVSGWQGWQMPGVSSLDLMVPALPGRTGGRQQRLMVYTPPGPVPSGGFPVIYALDGNLSFAFIAQSMHNRGSRGQESRGPAAVVVGIGQGQLPATEVHDRAARTYDYTPPYPGLGPDSQGRMQGGAEHFVHWLAQQVQPLIARDFPVNTAQQTLMGHSFGGLFCLYVLCQHTALFQRYVAASPSLWWGGGMMEQTLQAWVQRRAQQPLTHAVQLHLSQGSEESKPRAGAAPRNPDRLAALQSRSVSMEVSQLPSLLAPVAGLQTSYTVWPDADHGDCMYFACQQVARLGVLPV